MRINLSTLNCTSETYLSILNILTFGQLDVKSNRKIFSYNFYKQNR